MKMRIAGRLLDLQWGEYDVDGEPEDEARGHGVITGPISEISWIAEIQPKTIGIEGAVLVGMEWDKAQRDDKTEHWIVHCSWASKLSPRDSAYRRIALACLAWCKTIEGATVPEIKILAAGMIHAAVEVGWADLQRRGQDDPGVFRQLTRQLNYIESQMNKKEGQ
jgi:hypothetical protein